MVVSREGVVEMGYGGDVPRITCCGTCEQCAGVVDEVGNDHFHNFLREPGGLGRTCGGKSLDFDPISVPRLISAPDLVSEECNHCIGANAIQLLASVVIKTAYGLTC